MENIAIVGIANLFPGSSQPDEFWTQLLNKQDLRTKITEQEMGVDPMQYFGQQGDVDKFYCLYGGYIRNFNFDVSVFKHPDFDENYLMSLDELNKWALYVTYQALQNAGYWGSACLQKCGLILGNLSFPTRSSNHLFLPFYHHIVEQALQHVTQSSLRLKNFSTPRKIEADNGLVAGYPSALLAKIAGIGGAHFSLDAACASSCYSLKLACDMLHTGEVDMMLAGAVSAADPMFVNMGFSIFHAFPDNDIHAPFDSASKGLFAGEGAGMMVLKRHSDALRDGDTIHAVIKGGALSNDGKGEFILSPSSKGQVLAYHRAYADADVSPSDVGYIECHTTGTPKGDKVELNSMETFFSLYQNKPFLGSAKSNLGHLLTAAGMPGMIKAIYALNEGQIPATISLKNAIKTKQGYLTQAQMPTETVVWETSENKPRIAGVSVFGFGGSNAHLVLEGANAPSITNFKRPEPRRLMSIVGMDCLLTGINSLVQFDALLKNNKNTFTDLPLNRWKGIQNNANVMRTLGLGKVPRGGYIEKFDIDFLRFKVPPNAQDCLIPQQLMMMKVADNAARDANLKEGTNVAVLVAMGMELEMHQYRGRVNLSTQIRQSLQEQGIDLTAEQQEELINIAKESIASPAQLNQYTSFIGNLMASRIAALWDFSGPAFTVSSEENSVYRCVQIAQSLFATSDVEAVIIASVDLAGSFENISLRQRYGPVSESAISHSDPLLNKEWLIGEGAGAIVLQRSHAQDMRYAQIDALSFATGSDAQAIKDASYKACQLAQIKCADIDYVEAFASGFDLDNKAEIKAFAHLYPKVKIDSIKRQIGHLFNASGMFSLIKSALLVNAKEIKCVAINGLGKDMSCAHLLMSSAQPERKIKYITTPERAFSLVKPIYLGGVDIKQTILNAPVKNVFKRIKTQLQNKPAGTLSNGINLSPLKIFKDTSVLVAPLISLEATMKPPVKTKISSEIHQQAQAQQAFLRARQVAEQQIAILIKLQIKAFSGDVLPTLIQPSSSMQSTLLSSSYQYPPVALVERFNQPESVIYNQADLVEFAEGDISQVFGPAYKIIDSYTRRVRLPTTDYLLVSRVTKLDAVLNEYKKSSMITEFDIPVDAPFLIDGQIPWSVAVESGQCDLMLIAYIGIDFQNKGKRIYRLLDCELTFLEEMAFGGETLRYEIHIDAYAKNGNQLLFFFHYDCYVGSKKVLIMRNGCAGFFSDVELADGKGVVHTPKDKREFASAQKSTFHALIKNNKTHYNRTDMKHLISGNITACLGAQYYQQGRNPSLKFSSEKFLMIERITKIDARGGHWGLGLIEGQKDIDPAHWYFPCHFKGDQVMAGSLMSEGCGQVAMFFMLWLGMHSNLNNARFQPMRGEAQTVRCRGQVTPQVNTLTYRLEVTAIGMQPHPFVKANIDIMLNGKVVVDFKNLCLEMREQDENSPYPVQLPKNVVLCEKRVQNEPISFIDTVEDPLLFWDERGVQPFKHASRPLMRVESDMHAPREKGVLPIKHFEAPMLVGQNRSPDTLPFTPYHLFEFATGNISKCFGPDFDVYQGRIPPRTPCGDLQVVTQVIDIKGKRMDFKSPASCVSEYYVPKDAWYFTKNSVDNWLPYSLLMEISLQPNGFISGYMGTTLVYPEKDLFFRNLDGDGELLKKIDLRGKTIVNKSVLLSTTMVAGMIVQKFTFDLFVNNEKFYQGSAVFGYFGAEALANQLGMDKGVLQVPWFVEHKTPAKEIDFFDLTNKSLPFYQGPEHKKHYHLAGGQLNFLDSVSIVEGGGSDKLAYLYAERAIDANDWFFRYHFHQDPVMPGSLGIEAILELLQTYALKNNLGVQFANPCFTAPLTKVMWKYRGQITPLNKKMSVDVHLTQIIKTDVEVRLVGNANLYKDGLRIYSVQNIVLSIVEKV